MEKMEAAIGMRYPPSFMRLQSKLCQLAATPGFSRQFPDATAISTLAQLELARRDVLPEDLLPFMACPHGEPSTDCDYYAFDGASAGPEYEVLVFSVHTAVFDWSNFESFLGWMQVECAKP